jgi:hypothetical protein
MARMPGSAISPADQEEIVRFLTFHAGVRAGQRKSVPGTEDPQALSRGGPAPQREPVAVTREGLRIEALVRAAQPMRRYREGRWAEEAPHGDDSVYLLVRVIDEQTKQALPYLDLSARLVGGDGRRHALAPGLDTDGIHYGANLAAPPGALHLELSVGPATLAHIGGATSRLARPVTVQMELDRP